MNAPQSIEMLAKWLADFRAMDANESTTDAAVSGHLDALSDIITSMAVDYELCGLETHGLKVLAAKQEAFKNRILPKRFSVLDGLVVLAARLERMRVDADHAPEADPWVLHWRRMRKSNATHKDIAIAWKESHPEETMDIEQLTKRSKNEVSRQKPD